MDFDPKTVFANIKSGEMTLEKFIEWAEYIVDKAHERGVDHGEQIGYRNGYDDCMYYESLKEK